MTDIEPAPTTRDGYALVQFYYDGGPRDGQPFERPGFLVPHTVEHREWTGYYEANVALCRFEWRSAVVQGGERD